MASKAVYMPKDDYLHIRMSKLQKIEIENYANSLKIAGDTSTALRLILDGIVHKEEIEEKSTKRQTA